VVLLRTNSVIRKFLPTPPWLLGRKENTTGRSASHFTRPLVDGNPQALPHCPPNMRSISTQAPWAWIDLSFDSTLQGYYFRVCSLPALQDHLHHSSSRLTRCRISPTGYRHIHLVWGFGPSPTSCIIPRALTSYQRQTRCHVHAGPSHGALGSHPTGCRSRGVSTLHTRYRGGENTFQSYV
jgi:hypothetical protein